jgi:hypothetical protein
MYVNEKMRPLEMISVMGGEKRMMEGVNSTMIYCKNFCKYHNVSPVKQ